MTLLDTMQDSTKRMNQRLRNTKPTVVAIGAGGICVFLQKRLTIHDAIVTLGFPHPSTKICQLFKTSYLAMFPASMNRRLNFNVHERLPCLSFVVNSIAVKQMYPFSLFALSKRSKQAENILITFHYFTPTRMKR